MPNLLKQPESPTLNTPSYDGSRPAPPQLDQLLHEGPISCTPDVQAHGRHVFLRDLNRFILFYLFPTQWLRIIVINSHWISICVSVHSSLLILGITILI